MRWRERDPDRATIDATITDEPVAIKGMRPASR